MTKGWDPIEYAFHRHATGGTSSGFRELPTQPLNQIVSLCEYVGIGRKSEALCDVLVRRRSRRVFDPSPVRLKQIAHLLKEAAGAGAAFSEAEAWDSWSGPSQDGESVAGRPRFSYPVAGARNILKIVLACFNVEGCDQGLYSFDASNLTLQGLARVARADLVNTVLDAGEWLSEAGFILFICADIPARAHYYLCNYRLALLEAGHLSQNVQLLAADLNLNSCNYGAMNEDYLLDIFAKNRHNWVPLTVIALGNARS